MKGLILVKYNVVFLLEEVVCVVFVVKYYCVQVCAQQYSAWCLGGTCTSAFVDARFTAARHFYTTATLLNVHVGQFTTNRVVLL